MKYIGIDPSTKTGLVILNEDGTVLAEKEITSKVKEDPKRFMDLADRIINEISDYCGDEGKVIAIEGFSFGSRGKGVSTQYGIGWIIRTELLCQQMKYIEIPPTSLKKFATGKGNASKDALVLPIYKKWNYEHSSDNVRDAYVLAQMARGLHGKMKLTEYQYDALKKVNKWS